MNLDNVLTSQKTRTETTKATTNQQQEEHN